MSNLKCPFYQQKCILKSQANLPDFKNAHDCGSMLNNCSFYAKEKIKQVKVDLPVKILIKKVSNVYLVKADALVFPSNNLLEVDDVLFNKMTRMQAQTVFDKQLDMGIKMGYAYPFKCDPSWQIKQKYILCAVVAGESRLVNESDVLSGMKKSLLLADEMGLSSIVVTPCDGGVHDISLVSMAQLSAIFSICQKHNFKNLKSIYICMEDEESEDTFIEYYNRIFKQTHVRQAPTTSE